MILPDWPDPFALSCFHRMSSLLRICPPLLLLIGYFQPCSLCCLYFFTRFTFVRPGAPEDAFTYSFHLAITGSPVSLFSLYKRLAFSITYTMQPVTVYIRCTFFSQRVTETLLSMYSVKFSLPHQRFTCVQLTYTYLTANVQHLAP